MRAEYTQLMSVERPAIVEVVSWAAGNGDRSENGDYIYGRQKLRDIDRRAGFLARRMKAVTVVDPAAQTDHSRVWFGATVTIADADDNERTVTLVGSDESDAAVGRIGWTSPMARALRGAGVGDVRRVTLPGGESEVEVVAISYSRTPAAFASATTSGSASTGDISTPASSRSAT
jgi:transcription elongation factor GreB